MIPIAFTCLTKSLPKMRSRARSRYRGALSHGNASPQLLGGPFCCWMSGDSEMENAAPVVRQHQESGAPQRGFSRLILRISSRSSSGALGRPRLPCRSFQVQNRRKPFLCHAITVSGLTMTREPRQPLQTSDSHARKTRSAAVRFGRFAERCRTRKGALRIND